MQRLLVLIFPAGNAVIFLVVKSCPDTIFELEQSGLHDCALILYRVFFSILSGNLGTLLESNDAIIKNIQPPVVSPIINFLFYLFGLCFIFV